MYATIPCSDVRGVRNHGFTRSLFNDRLSLLRSVNSSCIIHNNPSKSGPLSIDQTERLLVAFVSNSQVYGAYRAKPFIRKLLDEGIEFTDAELEGKVRERLE